ncbi:MAG: Tetratricopeptide repeat [Deltaproteobacteria bacterium]|nr:Tetratricopeptide repeat [Deltaproteobacteria bacterium]
MRFLFLIAAIIIVIIAVVVLNKLVSKSRKPEPEISLDRKSMRELAPAGKSYYFELVDLYLNSGQTQRALNQATRNIAFNGNDPIAYINRARVYEKLGSLENAILDLEEALRISPDNKEALTYLEKIYIGIGKK